MTNVKHKTVLTLATITALAFVPRVWRLGERSLWFDEAFTWRISTFPWAEMLHRTTLDNNPPFHFAALKAWMALFGQSAMSLRLLSVLSGTAACVGMYLLMIEAYRPNPGERGVAAEEHSKTCWLGLWTAMFLAVSVVQIRWSWEVRGYALGTGLAAFSGWLLLRALRVNTWISWLHYVLAATAFAYTHIYALFSLIAQAIFVAGTLGLASRWDLTAMARDRGHRRALVAGSLVFAAWLLWLPMLLEQRAHVHRDIIGWPLHYWSVPESCFQLWIEPQERCRNLAPNLVATVACAVVLGALLRRPTAGDLFLLLSATVPPLLGAAVSLIDVPMYHSHYLIFAHLFLVAALARLVGRIAREPERSAAALVVMLNLLLIYFTWWDRLDIAAKPGVRAAVASIESSRGAGDVVVVTSPFYFPSLLFYLSDRANCYLLDDGRRLRHYEGTAALTRADFIRPDQARSLPGRRVWVVNVKDGGWGRTSFAPPPHWRELSREEFPEVYSVQGRVEVIEYEVSATPAEARQTSRIGGT